MTNRKTLPPLSPRRSLPTDEVAQTYARDAARRALADAAPPARDEVELEVDSMFCAEAVVAESEAHARMTAAYRGESLPRRGGR